MILSLSDITKIERIYSSQDILGLVFQEEFIVKTYIHVERRNKHAHGTISIEMGH